MVFSGAIYIVSQKIVELFYEHKKIFKETTVAKRLKGKKIANSCATAFEKGEKLW